MVTTQMKTDAQRLGNGKKAFNVKQVEKMMEDAGGSDYTAGTGIVIADDTISVDEQTVAMKSEIPIPKDWTLFENSDWSSLVENNVVKEDCIIYRKTGMNFVFVPKGTVIQPSLTKAIFFYDKTIISIMLSDLFSSTETGYAPMSTTITMSKNSSLGTIRITYNDSDGIGYTKDITNTYAIVLYRRV